MLESEGYEERGDAPAKAVLRANADQQAVRQAIETQEELQKIRHRVCVTLSAYEIGEELREESESNVETIKNAFVKDDAALEFLDDMSQLYLILSDPIAKRKYQQKVTIFVVGYENLCSHRSKLLAQLQDFFTQSTEDSNSFMIDIPELDFEEVGKNVRDALTKAEKTTERLANISKEVLKVFDIVNPKDHKKGKKKLEKVLYQSQQDVMNLTEKLVGVQSDFEDAKNTLTSLNKQVGLKELDIERLKLQVNTNKAFEKECEDLRKGLQAKEKQLQNYKLQMDEVELSLSQVENKYDYYVENCKKLKEENEKLSEEMEKKIKEQQQSIIETRKELEMKYDLQVSELKENQERQIAQLKQSHDEETKNLKEKLDMLRKSSTRQSDSTMSTPVSRDSSVTRYSSVATEYSQISLWKSSAKVVRSITQLKGSTTSHFDTASSQTSVNKENDSVLDTSESLTLSMSNTTTPQTTPQVMDEGEKQEQNTYSAANNTTETSTQTEDIIQDREVKSRNDLQQIEVELSKTPVDELPEKIDEYKNKFMEIQQQLEEDVVQWKIKFNAKAQGLNQLTLVYGEEVQKKEELMKQLSAAQEQQTLAEQEAEEAILQLEELRAEREINADVIEDFRPSVATKSTLTSASLSRHKGEVKDRQQSPTKQVFQQSVAIQCPSAHGLRERDMPSPQCSESHLLLADDVDVTSIPATDSGFEGSGNVFLSRLPDEASETNEAMALQSAIVENTEHVKRTTPVSPSPPRVRSRLVRSALKDHCVVMETIKTYEMITEFKVDIMYWLKQYGLENKSELLTEIPDVALDKTDELDVLSKLPIIRDQIRQIFDALWQVSRENYSWRDDESDAVEFDDGCDEYDLNKETNIMEYHPSLSLTKETPEEKNITSESDSSPIEKNLQARSVQTDKLLSRSSRTTPRGYTQLLHEYNNLNESFNKLQQQLEEDVKTYKQQTSQNAVIMNEMQETINNLRWQTSCNIGNTKQPLVPSVMFTCLDAERNVTSMKRAVESKRLLQTSFNNTVEQMNQYVNLPARRLVELVKRYTHHCSMKEVEENLYPSSMTSDNVYNLQERMEHLQRVRAEKWSEKMAEMSQIRSRLGDEITSSLNEIEESSGIFLIKPVYSYSSRQQATDKSSHPIICKRRLEKFKKSSGVTAELKNKKSLYPVENPNVAVFSLKQTSDHPMWISKESHVRGPVSSYENIPIPRLLAMDVNRIMLNRNPVSDLVNPKVNNSFSISGVRQYVTVERPIGIMTTAQLNRDSDVVSPRHSFPLHRSSSPSLSNYSPLPPISLPHMESHHYPSAMSYTNQSASSLSLTSSDER